MEAERQPSSYRSESQAELQRETHELLSKGQYVHTHILRGLCLQLLNDIARGVLVYRERE